MTDDRRMAAAMLHLINRLDWSDTTLDGARGVLAAASGYLTVHVEGWVDTDITVGLLDALGWPKAGPLFAATVGDWLGAHE